MSDTAIGLLFGVPSLVLLLIALFIGMVEYKASDNISKICQCHDGED